MKHFLEKYKKMLGRRQIGIWKRKLKDTLKFTEGILGFSMDDEERANANTSEDEVENHKEDVEDIFESIASSPDRFGKSVPKETFFLDLRNYDV